MRKLCTGCKEEKALSEFSKNSQAPEGLDWRCKACISIKTKAQRKRRMQDPDSRQRNREASSRRLRKAKAFMVEHVFGGHCYDCGESYPPCVFDFHHEGDKEATPSHLIGRSHMATALAEMEKCVMLCSNCHRLRHFHNKEDDDDSAL